MWFQVSVLRSWLEQRDRFWAHMGEKFLCLSEYDTRVSINGHKSMQQLTNDMSSLSLPSPVYPLLPGWARTTIKRLVPGLVSCWEMVSSVVALEKTLPCQEIHLTLPWEMQRTWKNSYITWKDEAKRLRLLSFLRDQRRCIIPVFLTFAFFSPRFVEIKAHWECRAVLGCVWAGVPLLYSNSTQQRAGNGATRGVWAS